MLISGWPKEGARGARPALFLDQNEARRVEKILFETGPQGLDDRAPPLSEGLDPPLLMADYWA